MEDAAQGRARARAVAAGALVAVAATSSRLAIANPILAVLLVAGWLAWRRGELAGRPYARALLPPLALFACASLLSAVFSLDPLESFDKLPRLFVLLLVPSAAALLDRRWWSRFVAALALVATVLAIWGIVQYAQGADSLDNRIHGPMAHYMIYSGWLLLAVA